MSDPTEDILTQIAKRQWQIADDNGWHTKTPLECCCLIHEEVAELAREFRMEKYDLTRVGEEMADIILRVSDLAEEYHISLAASVLAKLDKNQKAGTRGRNK